MSMMVSKESALKAFYYLMAVDDVTAGERSSFHEVGIALLGEVFCDVEASIISECDSVLDNIGTDEERYDVIQEALDFALSQKTEEYKNGIAPRLLLWNMLTLSYSDSDYSKEEDRLIRHVTRILQIDKSVFVEMKQLITVSASVQNEKLILEQSPRPYAEVKPLIEEVEKRQMVILEAATALIEDEIIEFSSENKKKKENGILNAGKRLSETLTNEGKKMSENMAPVANTWKEKGSMVGEQASKRAEEFKKGAGKFFSKMKDSAKKK